MNQLNLKIGKIIKDHREISHMTQLQMSKRLGYKSTQFVSLFERGMSRCPHHTLGKICKILDIDPNVFFEMISGEHNNQLKKDLRMK